MLISDAEGYGLWKSKDKANELLLQFKQIRTSLGRTRPSEKGSELLVHKTSERHNEKKPTANLIRTMSFVSTIAYLKSVQQGSHICFSWLTPTNTF